MKNSNQSGFSAAVVVIIIGAVVAIGGLIAWRVLDANRPTNNQSTQSPSDTPSQQQSEPQAQTNPNGGYVIIKEWGVRFKSPNGLADLTYGINNDDAVFSTTALEKFGILCGTGAESLDPLGKLSRTTTEQQESTSESGAFVKKIGSYYYRYTTPQTACSDDSTAHSLQTQATASFKPSIATLEAAK